MEYSMWHKYTNLWSSSRKYRWRGSLHIVFFVWLMEYSIWSLYGVLHMVIIWSTPYGSNFVHRGVLNFFFNNINRFTFHCNKAAKVSIQTTKRQEWNVKSQYPPTKTEQPCFRCLFVKQEQPSFRHLPTAAKSSHAPVDYLPLYTLHVSEQPYSRHLHAKSE